MPANLAESILIVIAVFLGGLAYWDYVRGGYFWTLRAKIWLRTALIIAGIAVFLFVGNRT